MTRQKAKNGSGAWREVIKNGKQYQRYRTKIGTEYRDFYGKTEREARAKAEKARKEHERNGGQKFDKKITVDEWLNHWLETVCRPNVGITTYPSYESKLRVHVIPALGKKKLVELTTEDIRVMLADIQVQENGTSKKQARKILNVFSQALKCACEDEPPRIPANPAANVKIGTQGEKKRKVTPLGDAEVQALLKAAQNTRYYALYAVALLMGLRQGEILALSWDHVDFAKNTIHVEHTLASVKGEGLVLKDPKSDSSCRTLSMPCHVANALKAHKKQQAADKLRFKSWGGSDGKWSDHDFVFTFLRGSPIRWSAFNERDWQPLLTAAGISRHITFHDLRHTFASQCAKGDITMHELKNLMGHAQMAMTADLYTHLYPEQADKVMVSMNAMVERLAL